ncbi:hypothetical protein [Streptococcus thermophilus]|nr:hypothetical protein [Streptococcus thermophilus]
MTALGREKILLTCAEDGLKNRGFGEEVYLAPLQERLAALKNRLD